MIIRNTVIVVVTLPHYNVELIRSAATYWLGWFLIKKNISRMTAEYLSEVSKNTPSLLKLAVLVLLVVGCTAYPTSFDSIEVVTKQGDTVIEGVISPDGLLFASPNKNATDIYLWKQATGRFEFSSSLAGHLGEV